MATNQSFGGLGGLSQSDRNSLNTEVMGLNTNQSFGLGDLGKMSLGQVANQVAPALGTAVSFACIRERIN